MDMLEDYLRAVSRLLPRAKRDDIIAELRDEILTRIEAKESELGRSLTPDETEALLRDFGHPIVVAARYRDEPQYIVGPALYPYWMFAVRFVVVIQIALSSLVFLGRMVGGADPGQAFGQALASGLTGVMTLIGFATVAAWIIERKGITIGYFKTWRVRDLRFLDFAFLDWTDFSEWMKNMDTTYQKGASASGMDDAYDLQRRPRGYYGWNLRQSSSGRGIGFIAGGVIVILWWTGMISFGLGHIPPANRELPIDFGALAGIDLAALKAQLYWPVLLYFSAMIVFGALILAWPRSVRLRGAIEMVMGAAGLALAAWLWTASPIAPAVQIDTLAGLLQRIANFFAHPVPFPLELAVTVFLVLTSIGNVMRMLGGLWELLTGAPRYPGEAYP